MSEKVNKNHRIQPIRLVAVVAVLLMIVSISVLIVSLVVGKDSYQVDSNSDRGISLTLATNHKNVKYGDNIEVKATITNNSNETFTYSGSSTCYDGFLKFNNIRTDQFRACTEDIKEFELKANQTLEFKYKYQLQSDFASINPDQSDSYIEKDGNIFLRQGSNRLSYFWNGFSVDGLDLNVSN